MKKNYRPAMVMAIMLAVCMAHAFAADIVATMDTANGTSAFSFRDSSNSEVGSIDSDGNLRINGKMGIGVDSTSIELHIKDNTGSAYICLDGWAAGNDGSVIELRKQDDAGNNRTLLSRLYSTHSTVPDDFRISHHVGGVEVGLLSLKSNGNLVYTGANTGVNTAVPAYTFEVTGNARITDNLFIGTDGAMFWAEDQGGALELGPSNSAASETPYLDFHFGAGSVQDYNIRLINAADNRLDFLTDSGGTVMSVNGSSVCIGTTTASKLLTVDGDAEFSGTHTTYYHDADAGVQTTTSGTPVDTDTSVSFTADGTSHYLIMASCDVGNSCAQNVTHVHIYRNAVSIAYSRNRNTIAEASDNHNVSIHTVDTPPAGATTYKIRFCRDGCTAAIKNRQLTVIKL